jgi:hypothetical protein
MFGGPPITYAQPYSQPIYAPTAQQYVARPPAPPSGGQRSAPQTLVRGQRPDDPPASERRPEPRPSLALPAPEQLGIRTAVAPPETDWNAVHRRLHELGSTAFQSRQTADGFVISFLLPTAEAGRNQRIEAQAATEAEAIRLALSRADDWARSH